jgi:short-subunit dehydrogenase
VNVASIGAFMPGPNMAVYYATKAYVLSFSEALAEELAGAPVRVTCLAPGPTNPGFAAQAGLKDSRQFQRRAIAVEDVARAGCEGFKAGKVIVVPGVRNRGMAFITRVLPRAVVRKLTKNCQS